MFSKIYSTRGSYIGIKQFEDGKIYFLSLHGKSKSHQQVFEIQFIKNQEVLPLTFEVTPSFAQITTGKFGLTIYMDKDNRINMKPFGGSFHLDFHIHPKANFEYNTIYKSDDKLIGVINSYKSLSKYLVYNTLDTLTLSQDMHYDSKGSTSQTDAFSTFRIEIQDKQDMIFLEECLTNFHKPTFPEISKAQLQEDAETDLTHVMNQLVSHSFSKIQTETIEKAIQILRSNTFSANGLLTCEATVASLVDFPSVYSWDNGFIALGTMLIDPQLGFNQLKAVFDHQDEFGQLPGSVSDSTIRWNFSKPPTVGFIILEMLQYDQLTEEQMAYLYNHLSRLIGFYLQHRRSSNGCFFYSHGNDSGMDNSTVFRYETTVESPDLSAYLIVCMEALVELKTHINKKEDLEELSFDIAAESNNIQDALFDYLFEDGQFVAKNQLTGETIQSNSLLLLMPIVLSNVDSNSLIKTLLEDFQTPYGIATEKIDSEFYIEDAYWRGSIWAPSTTLVVGGLERNNETDSAREIMTHFCDLVENNGFFENYGAISGKGLRDQNFSWTAAVYLYYTYKLYRK